MCAGGALATLAAAWAAFEYPRADIRCVTLGSPRVGNKQFVVASKYLIGSSYRLMHAWDPIPTVPPPQYLKHVKGRFWLRGDKAKSTKRPWYGALLPCCECAHARSRAIHAVLILRFQLPLVQQRAIEL